MLHESQVTQWTDAYFNRTRQIINNNEDCEVIYAVFMRRPVVCAPRLVIDFLNHMASERNSTIDIHLMYQEGDWVGAGEPMMYLRGDFSALVDLETLVLQRLGACCVAAYNAFVMAGELPNVRFLAMDSRHCAGLEMAEMMAYGASVGSKKAQQEKNALGFLGNATDATAHFFDQPHGFGTMPHALIGYAGSTLRAAEYYAEQFPHEPMTVLVDYFGREITDALTVCRRFPQLAGDGKLSVRLDTSGGRFCEGLDTPKSYDVLDRHIPDCIQGLRDEKELQHLVGTGVSAAAAWHMRNALDNEGFQKVKIVVSSGFDIGKCKTFALAKAPIDVIGTGSFLPDKWRSTYATADIVAYNGIPKVKVGREYLIRRMPDTFKK